jgi:hypothetical protein
VEDMKHGDFILNHERYKDNEFFNLNYITEDRKLIDWTEGNTSGNEKNFGLTILLQFAVKANSSLPK